MAKIKWFKSPRKLDTLPLDTLVTFSEDTVYSDKWRKVKQREDTSFWTKVGDTYTDLHPYSSKAMLAFEGNRDFQVINAPERGDNK